MLREARLSPKEQEALNRSLRVSKRKPSIKNISARDQAQPPPYAILPLLSYLPKDWIIWDSAASKQGFLGAALTALNGNIVIESGLLLDGADFLKIPPKLTAQIQVSSPPPSQRYEWIERSYDNRQPFALLMPFNTWAAGEAQAMFQRFGMSIIVLNSPITFLLSKSNWSSRTGHMAWFTWGLPNLKELVTYGHIPLVKNLPKWMVSPAHKREITAGGKSMQDRLAIRHATHPQQWPVPKGGGSR